MLPCNYRQANPNHRLALKPWCRTLIFYSTNEHCLQILFPAGISASNYMEICGTEALATPPAFSTESAMRAIQATSILRIIRLLKAVSSSNHSKRLQLMPCKDLVLALVAVTKKCKGPMRRACRPQPEALWRVMRQADSSSFSLTI